MDTKSASKRAAILLAAGVAAASRLRESHVGSTLGTGGTLHYVVHIALFALLTGLFLRSTHSRRIGWLLFLAVLVFGYGTEFYEHLKDGYPVELLDVFADALGACLAMICWLGGHAWLQLRQPRQRKPDYPSQ